MTTSTASRLRAALLTLFCVGCSRTQSDDKKNTDAGRPEPVSGPVLHVPRTRSALVLDGRLNEPDWQRSPRTGAFLDEVGKSGRPFSEARVLLDGENIVFGLYASDEDIEAHVQEQDGPIWTDDAFMLRLALASDRAHVFAVDVSAAGVISDGRVRSDGSVDPSWNSGAHAAVDRDGTLNDPHDEDEEWVVELTVPLASLGIRKEAATASLLAEFIRCDKPKKSHRICTSWGRGARAPVGRLELEL